MRFSVKNQTGETWPAYGMAKLGEVLSYDGPNADIPLYDLIKPDGDDGIYIVNGASDLADDDEGTAVHYSTSQYVSVEGTEVEVGTFVGAIPDKWYASIAGKAHFQCVGEKNATTKLVAVVPSPVPARFQAIMLADLFAAVNIKDDPSTALAAVMVKRNGKMVVTHHQRVITNRFKNISIDQGTYVKIEEMDGEYQPYCSDCPGESSHSESL